LININLQAGLRKAKANLKGESPSPPPSSSPGFFKRESGARFLTGSKNKLQER
jgi:hypothetical protein